MRKWLFTFLLLPATNLHARLAWADAPAAQVVDAKGAAEFSIDVSGRVTRNEGAHDDQTIGFFDGPGRDIDTPKGQLYVRVTADSSGHPLGGGAPIVLAATIDHRQRVKLPKDLPTGMDIWRIEVYSEGPINAPDTLSAFLYKKNASSAEGKSSSGNSSDGKKSAADPLLSQDDASLTKASGKARDAAHAAVVAAAFGVRMAHNMDTPGSDESPAVHSAVASALEAQTQSENIQHIVRVAQARADVLGQGNNPMAAAAAAATLTAVMVDANAVAQELATLEATIWDASCYTEFGVFDIPATVPSHTVELPFGPAAGSRTPSIHGDAHVTAWATGAAADSGPVTFSWKIVGNTATDLPTVLVQALQQLAPGKVVAPRTETMMAPADLSSNPLFGGEPTICAAPAAQVAKYRSAAQTSGALGGGLVPGRTYAVTATIGDGTTNQNGTWTVSKPSTPKDGEMFTVVGPKLQATSSSSGADSTGSSNKATGQFNSPPGGSWALLTAVTWDTDLDSFDGGTPFSSGSGAFPSYQWRPTTSTTSAQQVYSLDNAFQPLQRISLSLLVSRLFAEGALGRAGIGLGPTLLWGTGTNGALQQWTANLLLSPGCESTVSKLYIVIGGGVRFVSDLVGDTEGETVAVPRTNGNAPPPSGPTTRLRAAPVFSLGLGFDLSAIGNAVASLVGTNSPPGGGK